MKLPMCLKMNILHERLDIIISSNHNHMLKPTSFMMVGGHHTGLNYMQKSPSFRMNIFCHWLEVIKWDKSYDEANALHDQSSSEVGGHHTGLNHMMKPMPFRMNILWHWLIIIRG